MAVDRGVTLRSPPSVLCRPFRAKRRGEIKDINDFNDIKDAPKRL